MALTSTMLPLGTPLPPIVLPNLDGAMVDVQSYASGKPLVIAFTCNHCPYVQHIEHEITKVADDFPDVAFIAICSNDVDNYPDDDIAGLREQVDRTGWHFPYLIDADQSVAHQLNAACTPDFFCFDSTGSLVYRGAFDDARPKQPTPVTGSDLRAALNHIQRAELVPEPHRPSMGCGIKWKPGNEPA
jgi:thiol-disulfide isomerase/thioredoxin